MATVKVGLDLPGTDPSSWSYSSIDTTYIHPVDATWTMAAISCYNASGMAVAFGGKYKFDESSSLSAKIDQHAGVELSYATTVKPGVDLKINAKGNAQTFSVGNIGAGVSLSI
jgi:hypothetical protein